MQKPLDEAIRTYKKRSLPKSPKPNSVYYILPEETSAVVVYVTDLNGIPIKVIDLKGTVSSVTGTALTGTAANPTIDISNFISSQVGNQVKLSTVDGKLVVNAITSPDTSLEIIEVGNDLQIQLSEEIKNTILDIQNDISNLQVDVLNLENSKFDIPTGDYSQYLDGLGVPTAFPEIPNITKTSQLINDGENEINPFITLEDIPAIPSIEGLSTTQYVDSKANNFVRVLTIQAADLSGTGTIEEQICTYILALPEAERTLLETDSKWNVEILPYVQTLTPFQISILDRYALGSIDCVRGITQTPVFTTGYHNGNNALPVDGDTVYKNNLGTILYNNGHYVVNFISISSYNTISISSGIKVYDNTACL